MISNDSNINIIEGRIGEKDDNFMTGVSKHIDDTENKQDLINMELDTNKNNASHILTSKDLMNHSTETLKTGPVTAHNNKEISLLLTNAAGDVVGNTYNFEGDESDEKFI